MFSHIQLSYLALGIVIGVIGLLFLKPEKTVVYKYPNPSTCGKTTYKDRNGVCYHYTCEKVDCDKNEGTLKSYPLAG